MAVYNAPLNDMRFMLNDVFKEEKMVLSIVKS